MQLGYALSAVSKPLIVVSTFPLWIFFSRTVDRLGKGIRTGARDAMLSDEATAKNKGSIFGFHRAMDTLGAVAGPSLALLYLYFFPEDYTTLFILAFVPGLLAIFCTLVLQEKKVPPAEKKEKVTFFSFIKYWKNSPLPYRKLVIGLLLFALINSSDVFLLLKMKETGLDDISLIGVYIFYNLIYALFAFPLGVVADKIGLKQVFTIGLIIFSLVYSGMSFNTRLPVFWGLFFLYGLYAAATEGIAKAWISKIAPSKDTATAIGTYTGFQSICSLIASSLTGLIWYCFGGAPAFIIIAATSFILVFYFIRLME